MGSLDSHGVDHREYRDVSLLIRMLQGMNDPTADKP
jgi:hypothetical protein